MVTISMKHRFWHTEHLLLEFSGVAVDQWCTGLPANGSSLFVSSMHVLSPLQFQGYCCVCLTENDSPLTFVKGGEDLSARLFPHLQEWRFGSADPLVMPAV